MDPSRPTVTSTGHVLPFERLSPLDFERMCLSLVEREGFEHVEHLGASGSEQGRDIIAWRGEELWAFQCKRVQRFGPQDAVAEVNKVLALPAAERPTRLVFIVSRNVSSTARAQARRHCAGQMECEFWAPSVLSQNI